MKPIARIVRPLRFLVLAILIGVAGISIKTVRDGWQALQNASLENIYWSANQVEVELLRLIASVQDLALWRAPAAGFTVQDRVDILWSRLSIFETGVVGERLAQYDGVRAKVDALKAFLDSNQATFNDIGGAATGSTAELVRSLNDFAAQFRVVSTQVLAGEEQRYMSIRAALRADMRLAGILLGGVGLCAILIAAYGAFESRQLKEIARQSAALAREAEAAYAARTRFLATMSHEFRTPLNGAAGSLSLLQSEPGRTDRDDLLQRAVGAVRQLSTMLGNVLELTDLESGRVDPKRESFVLPALLEQAVSRGAGEPSHVHGLERLPSRAVGDPERVGKVIASALACVRSSDAGTLKVSVEWRDDRLWLDCRAPGNEGGLASFDGEASTRPPASLDFIMADTLAQKLGGQVEALEPEAGARGVTVSLPLQPERRRRIRIANLVATPTLHALCGTYLNQFDTETPGAGVEAAFQVVVVDDTEEQDASALRRAYSGAMLVCLSSRPVAPAFDFRVPVPIDPDALVDIIRRHAPHAT